jgi:integrase
MGRSLNKLSARAVETETKRGLHGDGGGLWLQVSPSETKSWVFRFTLRGTSRTMGFGPYPDVSLAEAREKATDGRAKLREWIDPIEARKRERQRMALESAKGMSFAACAEAYIEGHEAGWRNPKHVSQWRNTIATYASPVFGALPVQDVDTGLVMKVLEPLWRSKPETASRLRGRLERVLDWATVRQYREGENPARWRGHLSALLPARSKVRAVEHHPALPYDRIGEFIAEVRALDSTSARALEFLIMTAGRTSEVIEARWTEIDSAKRVWTVPGVRMKAGKEHRVPLSDAAMAVLETQRRNAMNEFVFPGARPGCPLSNMALLQLLRRMDRDDVTAHGFRSTFRDWAAERTGFPREVAEMALGHAIGDKVEAAYRRGDLFKKRRKLMEAWAKFCSEVPAESGDTVVPFGKGA